MLLISIIIIIEKEKRLKWLNFKNQKYLILAGFLQRECFNFNYLQKTNLVISKGSEM